MSDDFIEYHKINSLCKRVQGGNFTVVPNIEGLMSTNIGWDTIERIGGGRDRGT